MFFYIDALFAADTGRETSWGQTQSVPFHGDRRLLLAAGLASQLPPWSWQSSPIEESRKELSVVRRYRNNFPQGGGGSGSSHENETNRET